MAELAGLYVPYYQIPYPAPGEQAEHHTTHDYNECSKCIYDVLKLQVMECLWQDPIGYNTLGFWVV